MSSVTVRGDRLTIRLTPLEKLLGLVRDQVVPRAGIAHVQVWLAPNTPEGIEAFAPTLALLKQG